MPPLLSLFTVATLTAAGSACFFLGAYLMIPELFDDEEEASESTAVGKLE